LNGYLLDTDHCIRILQGNPTIAKRLAESRRAPVASCVIVAGELLYMALRSEKKGANLPRVIAFLENLSVYPADSESARIYGRLKTRVLERFGPREKARRRKFKIEKLGFKDNDLWIAAVALQYDFTLLSADSDFGRLAQVENLAVENWWSS